jgi:hypothetical protein
MERCRLAILQLITKEMRDRKVAFIDRYIPYFVASTGCHLINMRNRVKHIYLRNKQPPDLRMHIMSVAPPGWCKTFFLEQFLGKYFSMFNGTNVGHAFLGKMTEAAWVGTIKFGAADEKTGEMSVNKIMGEAFKHKHDIVGIEEFSVLSEAMKGKGNTGSLDNALLTSLDSGNVYKSLAPGNLSYETCVTMWTGTQPGRFNLSAGLGRRFFFTEFIPRRVDMDIMDEADWEADSCSDDMGGLQEITDVLDEVKARIDGIQNISWDIAIKHELKKYPIPHYEKFLYRKCAMGYWLMSKDYGRDVVVELDATVKKMFKQEYSWRLNLKKGSQESQVLVILEEAGGLMKEHALKVRLLDFGVDWKHGTEIIGGMLHGRMIKLLNSTGGDRILSLVEGKR